MAKEITDDAGKFFDEMDEKMEAHDSKRRKLSKKPGHSQPELSFLLFNPKANSGKENICYFNNKCFSQNTCNKSSSNKKGWRPPMRALDGSDNLNFLTKENFNEQDKKPIKDLLSSSNDSNCKTNVQLEEFDKNISVDLPMKALDGSDNLNFLTKENFNEQDKKPIKDLLSSSNDTNCNDTNCKTNVQLEEFDKTISVDLPSTAVGLISSLFHEPFDKSQTVTIDLSNLNPSISDNKENNFPFQQKTSVADFSLASESLSSICDLSIANTAHKNIDHLTGDEPSLSEKVNTKSVDNKPAPTVLNEENSVENVLNKTQSNIFETKGGINNSINAPISEKASANYHTENYQVENNNKENVSSKREEVMSFAEMLTQENFGLKERNILDVHENNKCNDKNTILNYNNDEEIGSTNTKTEFKDKDNGSMCNLSAHEDIINSIDMILSEGQNTPSNFGQEEKDIYENNEEDKNCQTLVDTEFDNSSNDECEFYDSNISTVIANERSNSKKQCATQCIANEPLWKNSTETKPENIMKGFSNVEQEGDNTQEEVKADSLPLPDKTREENNFIKSRTNDNEPVVSYHEHIENIKEEEIVVVGDDRVKNVCDVADEEYSCLMLSNSQLLEIEKSYYETPLNKNSTQATLNDKNCKVYNETLSNKKLVSVSTQTEVVFEYTSTEQCVPRKPPHLQWSSKMVETQRRLREAVQEIQRLNATLLKVRHEIWPQQNVKEMSDLGFSKKDGGNSFWKKKQ